MFSLINLHKGEALPPEVPTIEFLNLQAIIQRNSINKLIPITAVYSGRLWSCLDPERNKQSHTCLKIILAVLLNSSQIFFSLISFEERVKVIFTSSTSLDITGGVSCYFFRMKRPYQELVQTPEHSQPTLPALSLIPISPTKQLASRYAATLYQGNDFTEIEQTDLCAVLEELIANKSFDGSLEDFIYFLQKESPCVDWKHKRCSEWHKYILLKAADLFSTWNNEKKERFSINLKEGSPFYEFLSHFNKNIWFRTQQKIELSAYLPATIDWKRLGKLIQKYIPTEAHVPLLNALPKMDNIHSFMEHFKVEHQEILKFYSVSFHINFHRKHPSYSTESISVTTSINHAMGIAEALPEHKNEIFSKLMTDSCTVPLKLLYDCRNELSSFPSIYMLQHISNLSAVFVPLIEYLENDAAEGALELAKWQVKFGRGLSHIIGLFREHLPKYNRIFFQLCAQIDKLFLLKKSEFSLYFFNDILAVIASNLIEKAKEEASEEQVALKERIQRSLNK
jgi:hypothetical protein